MRSKRGLNRQLALVHGADACNSGRWMCSVLRDGRMISCKRENMTCVQGVLPTSVLKRALGFRGVSIGLHGGWEGLSSSQLLRGMQLLESIDMEKPHGRSARIATKARDRYIASLYGPDDPRILWKYFRLSRVLFAHFDLIFDNSFLAVVQSFKQDNLNTVGVACSRPIEFDIDGQKHEIAVRFESRPETGHSLDAHTVPEPHVGLNVFVDLEEFRLEAKSGNGVEDVLVMSFALLSSSHEHVRAVRELAKIDSIGHPLYGFYQTIGLITSIFSFDPTANGQHHVSTLAIYDGSETEDNAPVWVESTWRSERGMMTGSPAIRTAGWNRNMPSTDRAPVVHPEQNDQAVNPFPKGTFDGAIALLRRRGGNGFAQKAAAAKAAGAVGCIIFDGEGPLDHWSMEPGCSLVFDDVTYPNPGIPTLLVDKDVGMRLAAVARSCHSGARAQILVDSSRETLTKLPPEFEEFVGRAVAGKPLHLAVLIERGVRTPLRLPQTRSL